MNHLQLFKKGDLMYQLVVTLRFWDGTTRTIESELASGVDVTTPGVQKYVLEEIEYEDIDLNDVRFIYTQFNDIKKPLGE